INTPNQPAAGAGISFNGARSQFEANSNIGSGSSTAIQFNLTNTTAYGMIFGFDGSGVSTSGYHGANTGWFVNVQNGPINFGTNNALAMTLFASKGLAINSTTDPGAGGLIGTGTFKTTSTTDSSSTTTGALQIAGGVA